MRTSQLFTILILISIFGLGVYRITHPHLKKVTVIENVVTEKKDTNIPEEIDAIIQKKEEIEPITIPENDTEIIVSEDDDKDGLTLFEEAYFVTNDLNPDTDSDGFSDLTEIQNGFNPKGKGKLVATTVAEKDILGVFENITKGVTSTIIIQKSGNGSLIIDNEPLQQFTWKYKNNIATLQSDAPLTKISSHFVIVRKEGKKIILDVNQLGSHTLFTKK